MLIYFLYKKTKIHTARKKMYNIVPIDNYHEKLVQASGFNFLLCFVNDFLNFFYMFFHFSISYTALG